MNNTLLCEHKTVCLVFQPDRDADLLLAEVYQKLARVALLDAPSPIVNKITQRSREPQPPHPEITHE